MSELYSKIQKLEPPNVLSKTFNNKTVAFNSKVRSTAPFNITK